MRPIVDRACLAAVTILFRPKAKLNKPPNRRRVSDLKVAWYAASNACHTLSDQALRPPPIDVSSARIAGLKDAGTRPGSASQ
ncbi:hypothetical protein OKW46_006927 [Paraburkholderia sp. WSM4179]|nr:hypothetical protein [Paraburkholderia sp. WSM4179]